MTPQFGSVRKYPSLEIISAKAPKKAELVFSSSGTGLALLPKCALGACAGGAVGWGQAVLRLISARR